jgi:hypothetical protein
MPETQDRAIRAPHSLTDLMTEQEALRAAPAMKGTTIEAIMARVSAEVTQEAERRQAAEKRSG